MIALTARANLKRNKSVIEPQIILEVEGLPIFGALDVLKVPRFDDEGLFFDMPGLFFDTPIKDPDAKELINIAGSNVSLQQQLFQEKGMASSVTSLNIELLDEGGIITEYISPGIEIDDILTKKAIVYLNFGGGAHPEDSVPILNGIVDTIDAGAGSIKLNIAHPDGLKRQEIFTKIQAKTTTRLRYRSNIVQGINLQTQDNVVGNPTYRVVGGGTKGSETVAVVGLAITVTANVTLDPTNGSTASTIVTAIKKSQAAVDLVKATTTDGNDNLLQSAIGPVTLDSSTTLTLDSTEGMLLPMLDGTVETYIRIGDEVVQYTGISGNILTGISGAKFGTIGATYEVDEDMETLYRIKDTMKNVCLKMMLSRGAPITGIKPRGMVTVDVTTDIQNAIIFSGFDVGTKHGVTAGDFVDSAGSDEGANNFTGRTVVSVNSTSYGSYLIVDGSPLTPELFTNASLTFKSKYDVWPDGLGLQMDQVDVAEHERMEALFSTDFFEYDFRLKDTIRGDDFLALEVYRPCGCYSAPRAGRCSLGKMIPAVAQPETLVFDENNVVDASKIVISRSINKNFYNSVVYKFEEDEIEDKFKSNKILLSATSIERIKNVKSKPLVIESKGIRDTPANRNKIDTLMRRLIDRFEFGAETLDAEVFYKDGFAVEPGDTLIFGSKALMISDSTQGTRAFKPRVMEVTNRKLDPRTGKTVLSLLSTAFNTDANYGVIGPSSEVDVGATTTQIPLKKSILTPDNKIENYKWLLYVGEKVRFRNRDYSYQEEGTFRGFLDSNPSVMVINPPLSAPPAEDIIVDVPDYPTGTDPLENELWKSIHAFFTPRVQVVSSAAPNKITVASGDIGKFHVKSPVRVHKDDYSVDSADASITVISIAGNELTLSSALSFTADSTFFIDLIGFPDGRAPYRQL